MRELSLFTGAGGGILGSKLLGWKTVGYVEFNDYCQRVIKQRIADGIFDNAPIFGDIRAFNSEGYAEAYKGLVDIITGGFPCQDISIAGHGGGIESERSGLWSEMFRTISTVRPTYAYVENSAMLVIRGLDRVIADLTELGYDCKWCVVGASDVGAFHTRKRIWILATDTCKVGWKLPTNNSKSKASESFKVWSKDQFSTLLDAEKSRYKVKSDDERMGDGMAFAMDRFSAIGNGQVPICMATAFQILSEGII